jgi:hypothetical protein
MKHLVLFCALTLTCGLMCTAQTTDAKPASPESADSIAHKVPVIDGAAGDCSLDLTVTADGKPVYAADVKVHIAYGFGGFRKLDLQASTNVDGKVKFAGIPSKVRRQTLEFQATKGEMSGSFTYDPGSECTAKRDLALVKTTSQPSN